MNPEKEYQIALELASTSRYGEAERALERILQEQPGHIDALILLGKVEYYLRDYTASRARFETVLLYDHGNTTAYFGLQFFRERSRKIMSAVFLASAFFILIGMGVALFFGLNSAFTARLSGLSEGLSKTEESLHGEIARLELLVEEDTASRRVAEGREAGKLENLSKKLEQNADSLEALRRSIQEQIEELDDAVTLRDEFRTSLSYLIENLLREIQNLRVETYRFR